MTDEVSEAILGHPLIIFSLYTDTQKRALERVGSELVEPSDEWNGKEGSIEAEAILRHCDLFWLWVLGAYEVLRTMSQHKECFRKDKQREIEDLKSDLAKLRMPFAKQQLRGKKGDAALIHNELSLTDFDEHGAIFSIGDCTFHSRKVIQKVTVFLGSFRQEDIVSKMPLRDPDLQERRPRRSNPF